jgi:hypothetical protein
MPRRLPTYLLLSVLPLVAGTAVPGSQLDYTPARSFDDPRLAPFRRAAETWKLRAGPERVVVDQVCLVPDLPTFLAAIATWDRTRWFPVLIDDAHYTPKFLRAFGPARVVRFGGQKPAAGGDPWQGAVDAVGRAWRDPADQGRGAPAGDEPAPIGKGPPGVVVSHAGAPGLAGAVALAAGRFQPLVAWPPPEGLEPGKVAPTAAALQAARALEARVGRVVPRYDRLGDDCDFVTLAGRYPYRYEGGEQTAQTGPAAFDDLVGRDLAGPDGVVRPRWAFTGRLQGGQAACLYQAMCSLFLPAPRSAAVFNTYGNGGIHASYQATPAAKVLEKEGLEVEAIEQAGATVQGWHKVFGAASRFPLVLVGTAGGADGFALNGGGGTSFDIRPTVPAAVHFIHSFSAENPADPDTIAGQWLDQGAFAYFGSAHEPYLVAFRSHQLVSEMLVRGIPFGAAARLTPEELPPFGSAWRLVYLGDPLYTLPPAAPASRQAAEGTDWAAWPTYRETDPPPAEADPRARFAWALRAALVAAAADRPPGDDLVEVLAALPRTRLSAREQALLDDLLTDSLLRLDRLEALVDRLAAVPGDDWSPRARRSINSARLALLQRAIGRRDWPVSLRLYSELATSYPTLYSMAQFAQRLDPVANTPARRRELAAVVKGLADRHPDTPGVDALRKEAARLAGPEKP